MLITAGTNTTVATTTTTRPTITTNILLLLQPHQNQTNIIITNIIRKAIFNFKCMQFGECADEANCDGGGCGYVGSIVNNGVKERKKTPQPHH